MWQINTSDSWRIKWSQMRVRLVWNHFIPHSLPVLIYHSKVWRILIIFVMGIPILARHHLYNRTAPMGFLAGEMLPKTALNLRSWKSNCIRIKIWDVKTRLCQTSAVAWMSNYIPYLYECGITYSWCNLNANNIPNIILHWNATKKLITKPGFQWSVLRKLKLLLLIWKANWVARPLYPHDH